MKYCIACGEPMAFVENKDTLEMGDGVAGLWILWTCLNTKCNVTRFEHTVYYQDIKEED